MGFANAATKRLTERAFLSRKLYFEAYESLARLVEVPVRVKIVGEPLP